MGRPACQQMHPPTNAPVSQRACQPNAVTLSAAARLTPPPPGRCSPHAPSATPAPTRQAPAPRSAPPRPAPALRNAAIRPQPMRRQEQQPRHSAHPPRPHRRRSPTHSQPWQNSSSATAPRPRPAPQFRRRIRRPPVRGPPSDGTASVWKPRMSLDDTDSPARATNSSVQPTSPAPPADRRPHPPFSAHRAQSHERLLQRQRQPPRRNPRQHAGCNHRRNRSQSVASASQASGTPSNAAGPAVPRLDGAPQDGTSWTASWQVASGRLG